MKEIEITYDLEHKYYTCERCGKTRNSGKYYKDDDDCFVFLCFDCLDEIAEEEEKENINREDGLALPDFPDIPDGIDEELPF